MRAALQNERKRHDGAQTVERVVELGVVGVRRQAVPHEQKVARRGELGAGDEKPRVAGDMRPQVADEWRGVPAFKMVGFAGESFAELPAYLRHLEQHLPDAYRAGRDYLEYVDTLRQVARGELEAKQAAARMPTLRRVGGSCPCSKSVRWVVDEPRLVADNPAAVETPVPATA